MSLGRHSPYDCHCLSDVLCKSIQSHDNLKTFSLLRKGHYIWVTMAPDKILFPNPLYLLLLYYMCLRRLLK